MSRMTEEEYDDFCEENGLNKPTAVCEKCGRRNHYVCLDCEPTYFQPERLSDKISMELGES